VVVDGSQISWRVSAAEKTGYGIAGSAERSAAPPAKSSRNSLRCAASDFVAYERSFLVQVFFRVEFVQAHGMRALCFPKFDPIDASKKWRVIAVYSSLSSPWGIEKS